MNFSIKSRKSAKNTAYGLSYIADLINLPVGFFEIDHRNNRVNISESLITMCELDGKAVAGSPMTTEQWGELLKIIGTKPHELSVGQLDEFIFLSNQYSEVSRKWYKMRALRQEHLTVGALIDVTDEVLQRQRLEFERDYDPLTGLLNKTAFIDRANAVIQENVNKVGVVIFADLDNLKKMNDTYGHDFGDRYIQFFAECLSAVRHKNSVLSRISGDEFVGLFHGFESKEAARKAFDATLVPINESKITTSDNSKRSIEVSIGLSYYPDDSRDIDKLIKYSDYAMYEVKRTTKNSVREFNKNDYYENYPVIDNRDIFDLFIEEERVRFAYQPIVSAETGDIFAYEILMRPLVRELKSPLEVLKMAKSKAKLYSLEKMTVNMILSWISENIAQIGSHKIFVNSIPGQLLAGDDLAEFKNNFSHLFDHMVMEMSESDSSPREIIKEKFDFVRELGGEVGVDNFGVSYSHGMSMLPMSPEFIKIDMSLVRNADKEPDKQKLIESIVSYAAKRGIKTVAGGIETYEEMKTVIQIGADYIQGYYLAKPEFELCEKIDKNVKAEILGVKQN